MAKAIGSYTIVDFNDAISLSGYISSNSIKYQIYNPDNGSYTPDWSVTNVVLTPELYVTSTSTNIIESTEVQSVKWYKDNSTTEITTGGSYALSGSKNHILTIKSNILAGVSGSKFTCVITYKDATTGLTLTYKTDIDFSRVSSGGGIADALATTPNGNIFKNGDIASLTAECFLWRGSVKDTTNVTYQWYAQDSSVTTSQGGGVGWKKLSNTTNMYSGVTTGTLTVYDDAVDGVQVFKCIITDTDTTSNTYNNTFEDYVSFTDLSDPLQVVVESTGGDTFVNGVGSSVLTARLFQGGVEIDTDGTKYSYKWYCYDKSSNLVTDFGGTGVNYKTGKTLAVGSSDVDVKATFNVEVD